MPQKFELAIDLQYEHPDLSIVPDLAGENRADAAIEEFDFDAGMLDSLFTHLAPPPAPAPAVAGGGRSVRDGRGLSSQGALYDRAAGGGEPRACPRGADRSPGNALLGETFTRQGLHGEALERYREARREAPDDPAAMRGEARSLLQLGQAAEALRDRGDAGARRRPDDIETLMLAAACGRRRATRGGAGHARHGAPRRAGARRRPPAIGNIARRLGDLEGAILAYRDALSLDPQFAGVRSSWPGCSSRSASSPKRSRS